MSFPGTHTPTRAEIVGKARYQCPTKIGKGGHPTYYLTPELEQHFRRLYPNTLNRDMMRLFGISFVTMQRFKRQLGLTKNMTTIRRKQAAIAKQICEENGYYDSLRGKAPSEACIEASRQMWANGFHPMKALKRKSPRRYRRLMEQRSEKRKALWQKEQFRVYNGFEQHTKLRIPYAPYSRRQTSFRNTAKAMGYVPGNKSNPAERFVIFYTSSTHRTALKEQNGEKIGFRFINATPDEPVRLAK